MDLNEILCRRNAIHASSFPTIGNTNVTTASSREVEFEYYY
jgi:hypothetical protein